MDNNDSHADPAFALAAHVIGARLTDIPDDAIDAAKRDVLDTFGVMLGGSGAPGIEELSRVTRRWGGLEESSLLVLGGKMPAHHAALVNSAMGHALDFDDTLDHGGNIHPGTSVLAASLALAEAAGGVTGGELILAVTLGLDVSCRLALAAYDDRGWHRTGTFGIFGATAAAGKILRLSQEQMVHAFGIAYSQAAGNRQCIVDGALTKRFQAGQAAHGAVLSAVLAKEGFSGAANVFAGVYGFFIMYQPDGYDLAPIYDGLGAEFRGSELSHKPYPCGRPTHTYVDAAIELHRRLELSQYAVESVLVTTGQDTYQAQFHPSVINSTPSNQVEAQFNLPYLIGAGLALGRVGIDEIDAFDNPEVLVMAGRVTRSTRDGAPMGWGKIEVRRSDGISAIVELDSPTGSPDNPLSGQQLEDKFRDCAAHALTPVDRPAANAMINLIVDIQAMKDSNQLIDLAVLGGR